jgi:hypothetical protein
MLGPQHQCWRHRVEAGGDAGVDDCTCDAGVDDGRAQGKGSWSARWSKRDLSAKRYVYFWVDGIHVQARLEEAAQCLLVIIGATPEGKKELVGLIDGVRESAQSWRERHRTVRSKGSLSNKTALAMIFKLAEAAPEK